MRLTRKQRIQVRERFGGRCAYCGEELGTRWHADHVEPVIRDTRWVRQPDGVTRCVPTGVLHRPHLDTLDNLFPACAPCNLDKHSMSLESWRARLEDLAENLRRNSSAYRHALRFGQVEEKPSAIRFHFETFGEPE